MAIVLQPKYDIQQMLDRYWQMKEMQRANATQDTRANSETIARQFSSLTDEQKAAVYPTLDEHTKAMVINPSAVPEDPWDVNRHKMGEFANQQDPSTLPPEFVDSMVHQNATGAAMPAAVTDSVIRRSAMSPDEFNEGQQRGYTKMTPEQEAESPSKIAANEALTKEREARAKAALTPKPAAQRSAGGNTRSTSKKETSPAQQSINDINDRLQKLSTAQSNAIAKREGARGALDQVGVQRYSAQYDAITREINAWMKRRDQIMKATGAAATQQSTPRPDPLGIF
jgi:hypothetical protein